MMFTAIDSPTQYGSVYRSDTHEIVHSVGGFGIAVARVYLRGKSEVLKEFSGPTALQRGMDWCGGKHE